MTILRVAVGTQQGIVISASVLGKLKTAFQVAMVIALIAVHGDPVWLQVLIYVTVVITVLSGADYFFGLRRRLLERERRAGTDGAQGT